MELPECVIIPSVDCKYRTVIIQARFPAFCNYLPIIFNDNSRSENIRKDTLFRVPFNLDSFARKNRSFEFRSVRVNAEHLCLENRFGSVHSRKIKIGGREKKKRGKKTVVLCSFHLQIASAELGRVRK